MVRGHEQKVFAAQKAFMQCEWGPITLLRSRVNRRSLIILQIFCKMGGSLNTKKYLFLSEMAVFSQKFSYFCNCRMPLWTLPSFKNLRSQNQIQFCISPSKKKNSNQRPQLQGMLVMYCQFSDNCPSNYVNKENLRAKNILERSASIY